MKITTTEQKVWYEQLVHFYTNPLLSNTTYTSRTALGYRIMATIGHCVEARYLFGKEVLVWRHLYQVVHCKNSATCLMGTIYVFILLVALHLCTCITALQFILLKDVYVYASRMCMCMLLGRVCFKDVYVYASRMCMCMLLGCVCFQDVYASRMCMCMLLGCVCFIDRHIGFLVT